MGWSIEHPSQPDRWTVRELHFPVASTLGKWPCGPTRLRFWVWMVCTAGTGTSFKTNECRFERYPEWRKRRAMSNHLMPMTWMSGSCWSSPSQAAPNSATIVSLSVSSPRTRGHLDQRVWPRMLLPPDCSDSDRPLSSLYATSRSHPTQHHSHD